MSAWVSPIICSILQQQTVRGVSKINQDKSFTNLPPLEGFRGTDLFVDFASVESSSVRNDRCLFPEVWDLKNFGWITRWIGLQFNRDHWWTWWFSHQKLIWIGLQVRIWRFRCLKTLNILLKSCNCNAVMIFEPLAVLWVEIMFMNGFYDNNSSCEFRYINKDFKLQHL